VALMSKSILMKGLDFIASEVPRIAKLAAREERAAVVAWLRAQSHLTLYDDKPDDIADRIERGEHLPKADE
jgi:hypothetical protein